MDFKFWKVKKEKAASLVNKLSTGIKDPSPIWKTLISIYPGLAAVLLAFFRDPIIRITRSATKNAVNHFGLHIKNETIITILVVIYWAVLGGWIVLYFRLMSKEKNANSAKARANRDLLDEIKQAVYNAPEPSFFTNVLPKITTLHEIIQTEREQSKKQKLSIEIYDSYIKDIKALLCEITKLFAKNSSGSFTANLMYYIHNNEKNSNTILALKENKDNWIYKRSHDLKYIMCVLHSVPPINNSAGAPFQPISLPICTKDREKKKIILIPGAPDAALNGTGVLRSTDPQEINSLHIESEIKEEANEFFIGRGQKIKSILSIGIPKMGVTKETLGPSGRLPIIGVLNIDCDSPFPFSKETVYEKTYFSIMIPIVYFIAPIIEEYFNLFQEVSEVDNFS